MNNQGPDPTPSPARSVATVRARLQEAGLDEDIAAAYALLSLHGAMRAAVLADRLGWPRSKSYRVLESMQHDGLVVGSLDRPIAFSCVDPQELFRRLDDRHQARVDELEHARDELLPVLQGWHEQQDSQLRAGGRFRIIKGERVIARTVLDHLEAVESEVLVHEGDLGPPGGADVATELERIGGHVRVVRLRGEGLPAFIIIDGTELVAGLEATGTAKSREQACLWTDADGLVQSYKRLFEGLKGGSVSEHLEVQDGIQHQGGHQ